ncbi:MAG: hypothetical protein ACM30H_07150 [Clostridia bacterium]
MHLAYRTAALLAAACLLSAAAQAAAPAPKSKEGYLTDKAGNIVTSKTTGLCIRTKSWTAENADPACMAKTNATKH